MQFFDHLKYQFKNSGIIAQIMVLNLIIFLPMNFSKYFFPDLINWFGLPINFEKFIYKPWTILTSMFTHQDFGHIFYNMLLFFMIGRIFVFVTNFQRGTQVVFIYLCGGIAGSLLLFVFSYFLNLNDGIAYGASASVMAITVASGVYSPNYPINLILIGEIKLKWLVAFVFLTSTVIDVAQNTGGKIAHLGGSIFGAIYALQLTRGNDLSLIFLTFFDSKNKSKLKVVHKQFYKNEVKINLNNEEIELNILLDKINKSGYESLSKTEKEHLHLLSKKK